MAWFSGMLYKFICLCFSFWQTPDSQIHHLFWSDEDHRQVSNNILTGIILTKVKQN